MTLTCSRERAETIFCPRHQDERIAPCRDGGIDVSRRGSESLKSPDIRASGIFSDFIWGLKTSKSRLRKYFEKDVK